MDWGTLLPEPTQVDCPNYEDDEANSVASNDESSKRMKPEELATILRTVSKHVSKVRFHRKQALNGINELQLVINGLMNSVN